MLVHKWLVIGTHSPRTGLTEKTKQGFGQEFNNINNAERPGGLVEDTCDLLVDHPVCIHVTFGFRTLPGTEGRRVGSASGR